MIVCVQKKGNGCGDVYGDERGDACGDACGDAIARSQWTDITTSMRDLQE